MHTTHVVGGIRAYRLEKYMRKTVQYGGELAQKYSSNGRLGHPQNMLPYAAWLECLGDIQGKEILDLACGSGYSSRLLAERGAHVVGVDISPEMIKLAQAEEMKHSRGIEYLVGDAAALNLGRTFDIVTPTFLFNYARNRPTLASFIRVVRQHVRRGGKMVGLTTPPNPIVPRLPNASHSSVWVDEPWKEGSRVCLTNYDVAGNYVCDVVFHYWLPTTYEVCLELLGFIDIRWIPVKMTDECKQTLPNWAELQGHNCSIVLAATNT